MSDATAAAAHAATLSARIADTVRTLHDRAGPAPALAVVLGSGWGGLADRLTHATDIPYTELPAFPRLDVQGHAGLLRVGHLGRLGQAGPRLAVLSGRKHTYETGEADGMKGALRALKAWGCQGVVLTNASGSLRTDMPPGSLMLITDHLNMAQRSPLVGERGSERFVEMGQAYDAAWCEQARAAAAGAGEQLFEGVYAWVLGPQFETPAEIRMLQRLGADAVGMSTVPETILARHVGLRVLGLCFLSNMGCGLSNEVLSHAHTLAAAAAGGERAVRVAEALLCALQATPSEV